MPYHRSIINTLPSWGVIGILVICFSIVAILSYYVVRRYYPKLVTENMSPSFSVTATAVAFLLGFTIALLWQNYTNAIKLTLDEAINFYVMLDYVKLLAPQEQSKVISSILNYTNVLNTTEWPSLRLGVVSSEGWEAFNQIFSTLQSINVGEKSANLEKILRLFDTIAMSRLARLQTVDPILNIGLLSVILMGACFIIFSVASNEPKNKHNHSISMVVVIILISINIGLALLITYPFSGAYGVQGQALLQGIPDKLKKMQRANKKQIYAEKLAQVKAIKPKGEKAVQPEPAKPVEEKKSKKKKKSKNNK